MDLDIILVIVLLIVLGIAVFIELRYIRSKRSDGIERALEKDESFNALNTTKAVGRVLKDKGRDTSKAEMELLRASLAYDRSDYAECMDSVDKAKKLLDSAPDVGFANEAANESVVDGGIPEEEPVQEQATIVEARKLPPNYLESKFMIATAGDEIERSRLEGKDVSGSICLLDEARIAFESKDYDLALRKSLKAKKGAEASSEPAQIEVVKIVPPIKTVEKDIVKDSSSPSACTNCGADARIDDVFCAKCGKPIVRTRVCDSCGTKLSEDDAFCRKCGTEVKTAHQ